MPNLEDKLETLDKKILDDALEARDAIRGQLRLDSEQRMSGIKADIEREAEQQYARDTRLATIERDSRISKAAVNARKMLIGARSEIMGSVIAALTDRLAAFTRTEAYHGFLIKNMRDALSRTDAQPEPREDARSEAHKVRRTDAQPEPRANGLADTQPDMMYLTPRDYALYSDDIRRRAAGVDIRRGGEDMIGGVSVVSARTGLSVDNTLKKKVDLCAEELFQISGLIIDTKGE